MMPLIHILRKCTGGYKFTKSQKKIDQLIDDIKLFAKRFGNHNTGCDNTQSGYRDGIWHRKMRHANNEKWETIHDGKNRTTKSRKSQSAWRKENLQTLRNIGSGHYQTSGDERKKI